MHKQEQKRLDLILSAKYPSFSRAFLQKFIRREGVRIRGKLIRKPHFAINDRDKVALDKKQLQDFLLGQKSDSHSSQDATKILYDSESFFIIDKSPGTTTEALTKGFFPVHRLDKDTSGVLVIAKDLHTQQALQKQWKERSVKKMYIALVSDKLEPKRGAIEAPIFRSSRDRKKMAVSSSTKARSAYTRYEVIDYFSPPFCIPHSTFSLIKLYPKTGRTHQIRVHLKSIGHPVIGDSVYSNQKLNKKFEQYYGLRRQFLHAAELTLKHPKTAKRMTFNSKLPEDLAFIHEFSLLLPR